jgi:hypothetical protein
VPQIVHPWPLAGRGVPHAGVVDLS